MRKVLVFLGILNDSDLDWMVAAGSRREIPAGQVLIRERQRVDAVFVVLEGTLAVVRGPQDREVARLRSGEIVGEMSFVDARQPAATVVAVEKSSVLAIPRSSLEAKLEHDTSFASRFYRAMAVFLSGRMRSTLGRLDYGAGAPLDEDSDYADEIDEDTLDNTSLAGARFDHLRRRLR